MAGSPDHMMTVASAAGLLTTPRRRPYTVTEHGAVAFAMWPAVTYGDRGIGAGVVRLLGIGPHRCCSTAGAPPRKPGERA